jgi:hypothetical protein
MTLKCLQFFRNKECILCLSSLKIRKLTIIFFIHLPTMLRLKCKRATTYHPWPNALSALDLFTTRTIQRQWALSAINATNSCLMLMQSMELEVEGDIDDIIFIILYHCHHSILRQIDLLSTADSLFMNIKEDKHHLKKYDFTVS